jgi:hypothetical protein
MLLTFLIASGSAGSYILICFKDDSSEIINEKYGMRQYLWQCLAICRPVLPSMALKLLSLSKNQQY